MLIIITGSDISFCNSLADFLEKRSFHRIALSDENPFPAPDDIVPGRHHVMTGAGMSLIETLLSETEERALLFVGSLDTPDADLRALYDKADARFTRTSTETEIIDFIVRAISSTPRPGWDEYFIDIAHVVAKRGNCIKRKVAAVLVKDRRVVATGYNGTPRGAKNCNEGGCERCNTLAPSGTGLDDCVCNHAEENAICQAAYHGISVKDATLYCTHSPCLRCAKLLINAGIREVVYNADYPLAGRATALLEECGVIIRRYP